jgi:endo-alpha-1,4-polygalactosaminidase (GH114 family)
VALGVAFLCLGAGSAHAAAWWTPPQQLTWYWQLTATAPLEPTEAVDLDGFDTSAATVAALHARGQRAICYIDVGTAENWRPDYSEFPASVKGSAVDGWAGENWLDISQLSVLEPIMTARFEMCAQKGFDAVEPDNIDGYENDSGFSLTAAQQLSYDRWVAQEVHALGMAVFQKNDPDQATELQPSFDGELDEECNKYSECDAFAPYVAAGKPVLNAEYTQDGETTSAFCAADESHGIMGALYSIDLDGSSYTPCFGPSVLSGPITGGPFSGTSPVVVTPPPGSGSPPAPVGGSPAPVTVPPSTGSPTSGKSGATTPAAGSTSPTSPKPPAASPGRSKPIAVVDRVPPRITVAAHVTRPAARVLHLRLRCSRAQSYCAGTVSVSTAAPAHSDSRLTLTSRRFRVGGGDVAELRLELSASALRRVSHRRRLRVRLTVDAHDRAGRRSRTAGRLTLPAPPR